MSVAVTRPNRESSRGSLRVTRNVGSLDQLVASRVGGETRFDSLVLSAGRNEFSWTNSGTMVPAEDKMARVYAKLFGQEDRASTKSC